MTTLSELFSEIGHTDKHTTHSYDKFYGPLFQARASTVKNFLEIGVAEFGGGCLKAFCTLFPEAQVHGLDIKNIPRHNRSEMLELPENGHFHLGDGYSEDFINKTFGDTKWDIVLDDGPHTKESQAACLNLYHNRLAENGMIIIEDVNPIAVDYVLNNFEGDGNRLSVVDRRACPHSNFDEILIIYM